MCKQFIPIGLAALVFLAATPGAIAQPPIPSNISLRNDAYFSATGYDANVARISLLKPAAPAFANGFESVQAGNQSSLPLYNSNGRGALAATTPAPTALPVLFSYFSATPSNDCNIIRWATQNEKNVLRFEVLRSKDGRDFSPATIVAPKGDGAAYNIADAEATGTVYYRLSVVSTDGVPQFSPTIEVQGKAPAVITYLYPAVTTDGIVNIAAAADRAIVRVYTLSGHLVQTAVQNSTERPNRVQVSLDQPPGTYLLQVVDGNTGRHLLQSTVIRL